MNLPRVFLDVFNCSFSVSYLTKYQGDNANTAGRIVAEPWRDGEEVSSGRKRCDLWLRRSAPSGRG